MDSKSIQSKVEKADSPKNIFFLGTTDRIVTGGESLDCRKVTAGTFRSPTL